MILRCVQRLEIWQPVGSTHRGVGANHYMVNTVLDDNNYMVTLFLDAIATFDDIGRHAGQPSHTN